MQYIASGKLFFTGPRHDFYYEASGKLITCSHGSYEQSWFIVTLFKPRDVAWIRKKAMIGLLRNVAIKSVKLIPESKYPDNILYKDTYNSLWNENDLIDETTAIAMATAYWQFIYDETSAALQALSPTCR